ncbi:AMP-binding protein [Rhizobium leguminosarum]|uniref:AMP-binding protein n=1 Tax=Rhizobium leguminosarum TaxID=384 RepID=UPI00143F96FD|nr:AMP-binding protein [Rhizobium leguminosarum]MBY5840893.1 AMP-binding protein [Rhizobium leguminosarum]MBY5869168.1 AMP-binding protein [Rhizobium leguminosarum]MCA2410869.1 AMP-binding protein [Rhizobium leguminosarum]NKK78009.1 AMP-binding protein [Rhizobium leguminosarum bv. viciae]NKL08790.1 AMP-binding protein [Rhizobium leguminosarum bv. viciae]
MTDVRRLLLDGARTWPDRIAIRDENAAYSYKALGLLAHSAAEVCGRHGLQSGDRVALALERSATSMAIFLALMAAGLSVAVLPNVPVSRLRQDIDELGISLVIAPEYSAFASLGPRFADPTTFDKGGGRTDLFDLPAIAYLTLTSGSTGRPKAVMVTHGGVAHYARAIIERLELASGPTLRFAHVTTLAADLGYTAIFPTLLVGGEILVASDEVARDADAFWAWAERWSVNALKTTPSHFQVLLEGRRASAASMAMLVLGGEPLGLGFANKILESKCACVLVNHYGPTETTIGVSCYVVRSSEDLAGWRETVPIGNAFGLGQLSLENSYRTDDGGEVGELVVRGPGVSLGYLGRPDLTTDRFKVLDGGAVAFRTGDLCFKNDAGQLQFLGRKDRQIKVRGFIVNPPEVETAIEAIPGVRRAAVIPDEHDGLVRLISAVEFERDRPNAARAITELREALRRRLPHWMVPTHVLSLQSMPLTENGKRDDTTLRALIKERYNDSVELAPPDDASHALSDPQVELARRIAGIWSDLLGVRSLSLDADIIAAGADSIILMRSVARLRVQEWRVRLLDIHEHPTARSLAAHLLTRPTENDVSHLPTPMSGKRILSPMQEWFFQLDLPAPDHFNQAVLLRSWQSVDPVALCKAVQLLCKRHELLHHTFDGPSVGGAREEAALTVFGMTMLPVDLSDRESAIATVSAELHGSLRIGRGTLAKVHLFKSEDGAGDRILLAVHHLATDGVSWRILLEELGSAYSASLLGEAWEPPAPASFWDWTAQVTRGDPAVASHRPDPQQLLFKVHGSDDAGVESLVLDLTIDETRALVETSAGYGYLEAILLQGFIDGVGAATGAPEMAVDVEGHGRVDSRDVERFYGTIGWFTAVDQLIVVPGLDETFATRSHALHEGLSEHLNNVLSPDRALAELCFNFLGAFTSPICRGLDWQPAPELHGLTRHAAVDRIYACRLTARVAGARLIIDLVYDARRVTATQAEQIIGTLRKCLGSVVSRHQAMGNLTREYQSTSGLILLTRTAAANVSTTEKRSALLTGATGYLGLHLLDQMLRSGEFRPTCLVRGASVDVARNRVLEGYARSFGRDAAARAAQETSFICGDLREAHLGLPQTFGRDIAAVFHSAAETRLLGRASELSRTNADGARRVVAWVADHGGIPLHHVSTLAIAGTVAAARHFGETDFDIGQSFLSPYEASKFEAERVVRDSTASRSATYIYRMGHLAPDSRTGLFQANMADNRVYQTLKSYALTGLVVDDDDHGIAFSNADIVAEAIITIANSPQIPAGVFHIESPHLIWAEEISSWLNQIGYHVYPAPSLAFIDALLTRVAQQDEALSTAALQWAERPRRNIAYDNARTLATLNQLKITFPRPNAEWFASAMTLAWEEGFMPQPGEPKRSASFSL